MKALSCFCIRNNSQRSVTVCERVCERDAHEQLQQGVIGGFADSLPQVSIDAGLAPAPGCKLMLSTVRDANGKSQWERHVDPSNNIREREKNALAQKNTLSKGVFANSLLPRYQRHREQYTPRAAVSWVTDMKTYKATNT